MKKDYRKAVENASISPALSAANWNGGAQIVGDQMEVTV